MPYMWALRHGRTARRCAADVVRRMLCYLAYFANDGRFCCVQRDYNFLRFYRVFSPTFVHIYADSVHLARL